MRSEKKIISILAALNFFLILAVIAGLVFTNFGGESTFSGSEETVRYTLYIGLNDKDTGTQEISTEKAREIVDAICCKYVEGFTVFQAQGGWTDDSGQITKENTLVYMFSYADPTQITAIMDEVIPVLNQSVILVHTDTVQSAYYSGTQTAK